MSLQISDIGAVLKKIIAPSLQDQLPEESVFFDKVKKNSGAFIANNKIYISTRSGKHSGIYTVSEGTEPGTGKAKYQQPEAAIKYAFGTIEFTDQALEAAKGNKKAIASILSTEIDALKTDIRSDINRQWIGDGSGQLCLANGSGSSSDTLTVDTPELASVVLAEGMDIEVGGTSATIKSVDSDTQVTLKSTISWSDNDVITKANADEMMGLKGIIDDGTHVATIQGITRSSNPWANANVDDASETLALDSINKQYIKAQRFGNIDVLLMGEDMFQKYGALLTANLRHRPDIKEVLGGGWKGLEYMGGNAAVVLDYQVPSGFIFGLDFDSITRAELTKPFQWLEANAKGGILKRSSSNRTMWEGTLKYYANLVAKEFRSNFVLRNKTT